MKILAADAVRRSRPVTSGDEEVPNLVEILVNLSFDQLWTALNVGRIGIRV